MKTITIEIKSSTNEIKVITIEMILKTIVFSGIFQHCYQYTATIIY
jgi:hypothetical protein